MKKYIPQNLSLVTTMGIFIVSWELHLSQMSYFIGSLCPPEIWIPCSRFRQRHYTGSIFIVSLSATAIEISLNRQL